MNFRVVLALAAAFALASSRATLAQVDSEDDSAADVPPEPEVNIAIFKETTIVAPFIEQFTPATSKRWFPSESKKVVDGVEDENLLNYRGQWKFEEASVFPALVYDKGLVVKTAAAHHAISALFPEPVDNTDNTLVVQYEVKLQNGLECGGAYMKLLTYDPDFDPKKLVNKTPYTIMFGPDKCGGTNKVHFIFRHKNPITGEYEEKHLKNPPSVKVSKTSTVYTLIVRPDNEFDIRINNESVKAGNLLVDFAPEVNPPKEIDDPEDFKPSDWVDQAKIPDPDAVKPDDWDEDAPRQIEDEDAIKPDDWLEDEPSTVADPESVKPDDWDDEEDGDWVPPTVDNPKCAEVSGCGPWTRPMKPNPDYKGKWKAAMIDNPEYKGPWAPRKIPNPDFFEDLHPSNFDKIGGIGFELWTMQDGILFDNIFVGHSEADAQAFLEETWAVKSKLENAQEKKEESKADAASDVPFMTRVTDFVQDMRDRIVDVITNAQTDPVEAIKDDPVATAVGLGIIGWGLVSIFSLISMYARGKPAPSDATGAAKKSDAVTEDDGKSAAASSSEVPKAEKKDGGAVKRSAAKKSDD
ncbi:hypothetical protein HK405_006669 [Cladochytrium tenue]|nr:hypothetical protein HK405_006669 [Cladochytrium tenue]